MLNFLGVFPGRPEDIDLPPCDSPPSSWFLENCSLLEGEKCPRDVRAVWAAILRAKPRNFRLTRLSGITCTLIHMHVYVTARAAMGMLVYITNYILNYLKYKSRVRYVYCACAE